MQGWSWLAETWAEPPKQADEVRKRSGNGNVVVKMLDLASLQSVRALAKDVQQTEERLDILINNAGKEYQADCNA